MRRDYDYVFKLCMLGDENVGKTSIVIRYTENRFIESYKMTLGADFATKSVNIGDKKILFTIWDIGGQYRFRDLRKHYFTNACGGILIFDVTRPETFLHIDEWIKEFRSRTEGIIVLVGNKVDLRARRMVPKEAGLMVEKWLGIPYIETSAKTGVNVEEVFNIAGRLILKKFSS
ncbi:MAG: Rab family GTPase [Candidatus Asgardarchaeia archaeon]